jgi:hypothetical protein
VSQGAAGRRCRTEEAELSPSAPTDSRLAAARLLVAGMFGVLWVLGVGRQFVK